MGGLHPSIQPLTPDGARLIAIFRLDRPQLTEFRRRLLGVLRILATTPGAEAALALVGWIGFPDDLPNLKVLKPPQGNGRPDGIQASFCDRRRRGLLPAIY